MQGPNPGHCAGASNPGERERRSSGRWRPKNQSEETEMSHHAHGTVVQPTAADTHGTADHTHVGHAGHGHGHGTSHGHGHGTSHGDHGPDVRRPWTTLAVMLMAQFMVILDVSVVNVALP